MIAALATIRGASNDQSQLLRQQNRCMNFSNLPLVTSRTPAISSPILTLTEESCCPKPASLWFRLQPTVEMSESNENERRVRMPPTSCKEAVFREDGDGVEEEDHDYADMLVVTKEAIFQYASTVDQVSKPKEQRH